MSDFVAFPEGLWLSLQIPWQVTTFLSTVAIAK